MRRGATFAAVVVTAVLAGQGARADDHWVWTPLLTTGADTTNVNVYLDWSESADPLQNPTPLHGYVIVHGDGTVSCGAAGGPRLTSSDGQGAADPSFVDDHECHPTV